MLFGTARMPSSTSRARSDAPGAGSEARRAKRGLASSDGTGERGAPGGLSSGCAGASRSGELESGIEDGVEHHRRQLPGERVLLADVVGAEQVPSAELDARTVGEARARARQRDAAAREEI